MNSLYNAFISYGRADSKAFATKLHIHLVAQGLKVWFDQNDIPLGVDFQNQINDGITKADNFIFIIAPHSVNSPYCLKEIELAIKLNKRIIPLLHVEQISQETWQKRHQTKNIEDWEEYKAKGLHTSYQNMHPAIGKINWVYLREEQDDFDKSFAGLINLINSHNDYVQQHTKILVKALEWEEYKKQTSYLLIGEERKQAESWLKIRFKNEQPPCEPTDLHCEFICESTKNASNLLTQVFISYSEHNKGFMVEISKTLRREGLTIWTSNNDIKIGTEFQEEINQGIEQADNFIYLISPHSLESKYCQDELKHALANNKRIISLLVEKTELEQITPHLLALQFIDFTDHEDNEQYCIDTSKLIKIINQDADYYEQHKILLVKALKWQRQNRNTSILLRGYDLQRAEAWLKVAKQREEHLPLAIHEEFITTSVNQPTDSSLEVFVSYSRADSDFARKLNEALQKQGKTTWFDQESIASGTDFQKEIYHGIENSDNFLFIISPRSIKSPYCADEVEYARKLNKRFVTVLHKPVSPNDLHPALASIQWIDFNQDSAYFYANFSELIRVLDTDREHVSNHTKWSQQALEWEKFGRNSDLLLRGSEFAIAEQWLNTAVQQNKQPPATNLQKAFITASSEAIANEIKREKRQGIILKSLLGLMSVAFVAALGSTIVALNRSQEAKKNYQKAEQHRREAQKFTEGQINALTRFSLTLSQQNQELDALVEGLRAVKPLQNQSSQVNDKTKSLLVGALLRAFYGVKEQNRLRGHSDIYSFAFSPDGQTIATVNQDKTVKLWSRQGKLLHSWKTDAYFTEVAFSPDGQTIASASFDKIKLWNRQGKLLQTFKPHNSLLNSIAFSPDGQTIAGASMDKTVKLWSRQGKLLHTFKGHRDDVNSIAFSPDGQTIASASDDKTVKLWSRQGKLLHTIKEHGDEVYSVVFSPDGQTIASAIKNKTVKLWSRQGKLLQTFQGHSDEVNSVAFSPDGQTIASASDDKTVKLWSHQGQPLQTFQGSVAVSRVAFSPDGKTIASAGGDDAVKLWHPQNQLLQTLNGHTDIVYSVAFSPDGQTIVSASLDSTFKLLSIQGKLLQTFQGHSGAVASVAFSPDGRTIASAGVDKTVKLWSRQGKLLHTLAGHTDIVYSLAFSPDGQTIASASWDKTIKLWNLQGKLLHTLAGHTDIVFSVAFSPDGTTIASASEDKTVKLWSRQGKLLHTLTGHSDTINKVAFSPDGQTIASASEDKTVKLWSRQGKLLQTLTGFTDAVQSIAFSPDGQKIASVSYDKLVRIWNLEGQLMQTLAGHKDRVISVAFSPDGKTIASASADKTVILWSLELKKLDGKVIGALTLDEVLMRSCKWMEEYLKYSSSLDESDRTLCDGVSKSIATEAKPKTN